MPYQIGPTSGTMEDAKERLGYYPRSSYVQELEDDHAGGRRPVGYPRSAWIFAALTLDQYKALVQTLLTLTTGEYSHEVYIETRDEWDNYQTYRAMMRLPDPETLDRWGETYKDVVLNFTLLEVIP